MKIEPEKVTTSDVAENYRDNDEEGIIGYDGKFNIRPKYQREFVYDSKQRDAIRKGFPLNVMYWAINEDGTFEVLDGQHVFEIGEMEGDHIKSWFKISKTLAENCQMLCIPCNRAKSSL